VHKVVHTTSHWAATLLESATVMLVTENKTSSARLPKARTIVQKTAGRNPQLSWVIMLLSLGSSRAKLERSSSSGYALKTSRLIRRRGALRPVKSSN